MALVRPGFGPGPVSGGATPPTPPAWITGTHPPDPGGPAWHVPSGLPGNLPGNLSHPGHPAAYYTTPTGTGLAPGAGAGYTLTGTHPALNLILGTGTTLGNHVPVPPVGPPTPHNWFGPPGTGGDPYGPPVQPPTNWLDWLRGMYLPTAV